ncbi:EAL domain-containing protein [Xanthobacter sediminis]|uniref:EAL domain-containing protein n=1 Tax=Xanthobacter sediminis TaxID=3119926 RepID=UPI00372B175A
MKKRIFILDDDDAFREDLGELLVMWGHDVDGRGAVDASCLERIGCYDLLLLDLSLPGLDGTEVIRALSHLPVRPQVVLVSGSAEDVLSAVADASRLQGMPILGTLKKPFDPADLLHLVDATPCLAQTPAGGVAQVDRATVARALDAALARGDLPVMFQPKVDACDLSFRGAELLLGNDLPGVGWVPVPAMIEAAADWPELMARLVEHTVRAGLAACRLWQGLGYSGAVSINMPHDVLLSTDAPKRLAQQVREAGIESSSVICELTEDALYDNSSDSLMTLAQLRLAGLGLALDDVGQRQSGLLQLARLPVTELKIDMDLLHGARTSSKAGSILVSLTELGHRLGMKVVAEGVETSEDLAIVRAAGVDMVQGYLIARKMPVGDLVAWLASHEPCREAVAAGGAA